MRPDKNTVKQLLLLPDDELLLMVKGLCAENKINMNIGKSEIAMLRTVLSNASDADIERFLSVLFSSKGGGKGNG